jgi:ribosomal protein L13
VNASKIVLTAGKGRSLDVYRHSGFPGGLKTETFAQLMGRKPEEAVRRSIRGMLPKNRLGRQMLTKLKVYAGPTTRTRPSSRSARRGATPSAHRIGQTRRCRSRSCRPPAAARAPSPGSACVPAGTITSTP